MGRREITDDSRGPHSTPYEREETDAEWHGRVLEGIEEPQGDIRNSLQRIETALENIDSHLGQIADRLRHPPQFSQTSAPMSVWRFIFSWAMAIILFVLYLSYK